MRPWIEQLVTDLQLNRHRQLLVLNGSLTWRNQWINQALDIFNQLTPNFKAIEVSTLATTSWQQPAITAIKPQQLAHHLGQEIQLALFSSEQGIFPNSLAQACGMITAGGLAIISLDSNWLEQENPAMKNFTSTHPGKKPTSFNFFRKYLSQYFMENALFIQEGAKLPALNSIELKHEAQLLDKDKPFDLTANQPNAEQRLAIQAIQSVAFGHRKRPLLLTADRGRGKSATLGFAAIELFKQGKQNIVVTSARLEQALTIFKQATNYAKTAKNKALKPVKTLKSPGVVSFTSQLDDDLTTNKPLIKHTLSFIPPDKLLENSFLTDKASFDVLFIDEAAHIPLPMLTKMVKQFHRIVFATTNSGYEGTGRGFQLKFSHFLNQQTPGWKTIKLSQPIRWNKNDPLENIINNILLLNLSNGTQEKNLKKEIFIRATTAKELIKNTALLAEVFSLLVNAHYQTTPNDLMQLLENTNLEIWLASSKQHDLLGVLLATQEGGFSKERLNNNLRGHLSAQILATQSANHIWLTEKSIRINRIAVQQNNQLQGIGTKLVSHCLAYWQQQNLSYVSVTFGATKNLLSFWQKQAFVFLHLGIKKDHISGSYSATLLHALQPEISTQIKLYQTDYAQQFAYLLQNTFQDLESQLTLNILKTLPYKKVGFPRSFLNKQPYEAVSFRLYKWSLCHINWLEKLPKEDQEIWVKKIIQNKNWSNVCQQCCFSSKKSLKNHLKAIIKNKIDLT